MRKPFTTLLMMGALSAAPVVAFAAQGASTPAATTAKAPAATTAKKSAAATTAAPAAASTHATRGVVKSINDSTLVISRSGKKAGEMTLALNSATERQGSIAVGSPVSVRYKKDGKNFVATAVRVQQPKAQADHTTASKH